MLKKLIRASDRCDQVITAYNASTLGLVHGVLSLTVTALLVALSVVLLPFYFDFKLVVAVLMLLVCLFLTSDDLRDSVHLRRQLQKLQAKKLSAKRYKEERLALLETTRLKIVNRWFIYLIAYIIVYFLVRGLIE